MAAGRHVQGASNPTARREEQGVVLIAAVILVTVFLILGLLAASSSLQGLFSASHTSANSGADASANAGLGTALYQVSAGDYTCQLSGTLSPSPNAGPESYSVTLTYYDHLADPEPAPTSSNSVACSGGTVPAGVPFGAVLVSSTGTANYGGATGSETITELLAVTDKPGEYVLFSGNTSGADLTNLQVMAPPPNYQYGTVYSNGNVTDAPSSGPCNQLNTSLIAVGSISLNAAAGKGVCAVAGSLDSKGTVTLSAATVGGSVNTSTGGVILSDAAVTGDVVAGGSSPGGTVLLCPTTSPPASCSGLVSGPSTIGKTGGGGTISSATAGGSITVGPTAYTGTTCPGPVTDGGDEVTGCVYADNTSFQASPPGDVPMPTVAAPVNGGTASQQAAYTAWSGAGYTIDTPTSTCSGTAAGSAYYEIANASGPTVVVADCALALSQAALGTTETVTLDSNLAIFASGGLTLGTGFAFTAPKPSSPSSFLQLSLLVPTPATCAGNDFQASANDIPNNLFDTFVYTPCSFTVPSGLGKGSPSFLGEVVAGALSLGSTVQLTYVPCTPPGVTFGYQELAKERYVTQG